MIDENERIGSLVASWRKSAGLSQGRLADAIDTQQATISKLESGTYRLTVEQLLSILNACGITLREAVNDIEEVFDLADRPLWERINEQ
ncbi:MAG: helix-turn-helix transcriptional regulator [Eggerthellaceae bacterium]|nr:helix-turn-helix transcriptional regulator [Eggerthellaceae bacterium]